MGSTRRPVDGLTPFERRVGRFDPDSWRDFLREITRRPGDYIIVGERTISPEEPDYVQIDAYLRKWLDGSDRTAGPSLFGADRFLIKAGRMNLIMYEGWCAREGRPVWNKQGEPGWHVKRRVPLRECYAPADLLVPDHPGLNYDPPRDKVV